MAASVWRVPYEERAQQAEEWARACGLSPAAADGFKVCLICIDLQNTFCLPDFELFVAGRSGRGAIDDNIRLCRFIYRNLGWITGIHPTMDTHTAMQIFHPVFWVDPDGGHPAPYTVIGIDAIRTGAWMVNPAVAASVAGGDHDYLRKHAAHYVQRLTEAGKYPLIIWPYHSMLGGVGHALVPIVEEALFFHCIARGSQTAFQVKGRNALTENYSVLRPEVLDGFDGRPIAGKNSAFIEELLSFDAVVIAGQAKSHCVAWTIDDLLREIMPREPELVRKVYLLEDCTSPVVVSGADFTEQAAAAFRRFADAGMHVVQSTDPVATWPGMRS
jgi:nicotinamidase-related amidase